ncbi:hypothetical protein AB0N19_19210, partial [Streptomyces sp. NPDC051132]
GGRTPSEFPLVTIGQDEIEAFEREVEELTDVAGGLLVLLGGGAYLVNRRWPLPELMRRRTRP